MSTAESHEELVEFDEAFHNVVAAAAGNATLASMLNGVSSRTTRGRAWRGVIEAGATERTISEHAAILPPCAPTTPKLAEAAALLHVSTTERWFASLINASGDTADGLIKFVRRLIHHPRQAARVMYRSGRMIGSAAGGDDGGVEQPRG